MSGARRSARPARIALASTLGRDIDGAWWPRTASLAGELPELIQALHRRLGEIIDISVNWSPTDRPPDLNSLASGGMSVLGWHDRRRRLMVIVGRRACANLLVVPHLTSAALGLLVLQRAAAIPIPRGQQDSPLCEAADCIVRAAQAESAQWAERRQNADPAENRASQASPEA